MDVLTDVLNSLELRGWLHSRTEAAGGWRFDFAASDDSIFHILNRGGGYLRVAGEDTPIKVASGDVIVFPHGDAHALCDELTAPLTQVVRLDYDAHRQYQVFSSEDQEPTTAMLCGAFHLENADSYPLLRCLPKLIHIPGEHGQLAQGFADTVNRIAREAGSPRAGTEVMLRRLTEILFIEVIRVWIDQQAPSATGWLGALRDQPIGTALGLIHQSPEHPWKVRELADAVSLSRSAFSARFTRLVGEPPLGYLTRWRMHRATRLLRDGTPTERIARQLGYDSAVAFRKAFKREVGIPPAAYRKLT